MHHKLDKHNIIITAIILTPAISTPLLFWQRNVVFTMPLKRRTLIHSIPINTVMNYEQNFGQHKTKGKVLLKPIARTKYLQMHEPLLFHPSYSNNNIGNI